MGHRFPGYKKRTIDVLDGLQRICGMGHTIEEAAHFVGVSRRQLERWRRQSSAIDDAVRKGLANAHVSVTKSLFDAATGRAVKEERTEPVLDGNGQPVFDPKTGKAMVRTLRTYFQPSLGSQVFILCNRYSDRWKNVQRVEVENRSVEVKELLFAVRAGDESAIQQAADRLAERALPKPQIQDAEQFVAVEPGGNGHGNKEDV